MASSVAEKRGCAYCGEILPPEDGAGKQTCNDNLQRSIIKPSKLRQNIRDAHD